MKKILYLCLILLLTACSKEQSINFEPTFKSKSFELTIYDTKGSPLKQLVYDESNSNEQIIQIYDEYSDYRIISKDNTTFVTLDQFIDNDFTNIYAVKINHNDNYILNYDDALTLFNLNFLNPLNIKDIVFVKDTENGKEYSANIYSEGSYHPITFTIKDEDSVIDSLSYFCHDVNGDKTIIINFLESLDEFNLTLPENVDTEISKELIVVSTNMMLNDYTVNPF